MQSSNDWQYQSFNFENLSRVAENHRWKHSKNILHLLNDQSGIDERSLTVGNSCIKSRLLRRSAGENWERENSKEKTKERHA